MKTVLLCDYQFDYVTGSMSVKKKGKLAVEETKIYLNRNKEDIDKVIFKIEVNKPDCPKFKRNGGDMPSHCLEWTPGYLIEATVLKLLIRLGIPYEVCPTWDEINIPIGNELIIAGMNGNTTVRKAVDKYWNLYDTTLYWPGTWFFEHDEKCFRHLRNLTQGIFERPKRNVKTDLYVQRCAK